MTLAAGFVSFWADSELWAVSATKYLFSGEKFYYFGTKPAFHFLLWVNQIVARALHVFPIDLARFGMILNTIGILIACYLILKRLSDRRHAFVGLAILMSLSFFVKRSGHVRSDTISTHIILWTLVLDLYFPKRYLRLAIVPLLCLALLVTPKAIFLVLASAPFFMEDIKRHRRSALWLAGGAGGLVALCLAIPGTRHWLMDPLLFFIRSFSSHEVGYSYFGLTRFEFVFRLLRENVLFFAAFVGLNIRSIKQIPDAFVRKLRVMTGLLILLVIFYPDRLPFFLTSLLPFFVLEVWSLPIVIEMFRPATDRVRIYRYAVIGICFLLTLNLFLKTVRSHSSQQQRAMVTWLQNRLDQLPPVEVYDPSGILPFQRADNWFLGPGQLKKNRFVMGFIKQNKPEVILYSAKLKFLEPDISHYLHAHYTWDRAGIFVRSIEIKPDKKGYMHTQALRDRLSEQFPRLAGKGGFQWDVELHGPRGLVLRQKLSWEILEKKKTLRAPPGISEVVLQPFRIQMPYSGDLFSEFKYDTNF